MRTWQVPPGLWRTTFDGLSRAYDGAIVSLEILGDDDGPETEVVNQPLRGLSSDRGGVTICIARQADQFEHLISHPTAVRIAETDEGAVIAVEIEEGGTHTLLHFKSAFLPELSHRAVE